MEKNVYDVLEERGFISQITHEKEVKELLGGKQITFYIGFDPTADSLTVGHFLTVMAMAHMQRAGHRPIVLVGGGTGMVGDPTDRTEMRRVMTAEEVEHNCNCFKRQMSKFIDFADDKAIMVNNADWLLDLKYVSFIREYGVHFSVNRMLTADAYRSRFEKGLTFFEFNYMLMQSYDFLELFRRYGCTMQLGGQDQWSNIIGGIELIRRVDGKEAFGMTFSLLTTSDGTKMGKSQKGAVWLDAEKTSPYEFFQYWRNVDDADVIRFMKLLTFMPMEEIGDFAKFEGSELNKAKERLAYEITKIVHSEDEAEKALAAARQLFGGGVAADAPQTEIARNEFEGGMNVVMLLERCGLLASRSEGRRIITQGGLKINSAKVESVEKSITLEDFDDDGSLMIQKGKKIFHKVKFS